LIICVAILIAFFVIRKRKNQEKSDVVVNFETTRTENKPTNNQSATYANTSSVLANENNKLQYANSSDLSNSQNTQTQYANTNEVNSKSSRQITQTQYANTNEVNSKSSRVQYANIQL